MVLLVPPGFDAWSAAAAASWEGAVTIRPVPGAEPDDYDLPSWAPCAEIATLERGAVVAIDPERGTKRTLVGGDPVSWCVWGPDCGACTFFRHPAGQSVEAGRPYLFRDQKPIAALLPGFSPAPHQFVWSASGRHLLMNGRTAEGRGWELRVVDGKTGIGRIVPMPPDSLLPPAAPGSPRPEPQMGSFAPDDSAAYYTLILSGGAFDGERGIWRYDLRTREVTRVLRGGWCEWPVCSPGGAWIAYLAKDAGSDEFRRDLWVVQTKGDGVIRLTRDPEVSCSGRPAWSPDGKRIVVAIAAVGQGALPRLHFVEQRQ